MKILFNHIAYQFLKWTSFCTVSWYLLFYSSIACYEHNNTTNKFLRAIFTSVCNKDFLTHLKLFIKFLSTFWNFNFQNTGCRHWSSKYRPAKLAVKYLPGRWNTGHLASLITGLFRAWIFNIKKPIDDWLQWVCCHDIAVNLKPLSNCNHRFLDHCKDLSTSCYITLTDTFKQTVFLQQQTARWTS